MDGIKNVHGNHMNLQNGCRKTSIYEFEIQDVVPDQLKEWFNVLSITEHTSEDGITTTRLSVGTIDQAALHGLLNRVLDLNLTLVSVHRIGSPGKTGTTG
jgi:hypothetical protein